MGFLNEFDFVDVENVPYNVLSNGFPALSDVIQVLKGVSLFIEDRRIVSLVGSNGAGKTTTLKAISGLLKPENGKVTEDSIEFKGSSIQNLPPEAITRLGIIQVLEGRQDFKYLTVEENLRVGTATRFGKPYMKDLERVYELFPALARRKKTLSGFCSGGELQMMVIGRALMAHPDLLLDEPSLSLAPLLLREIFRIIRRINQEQVTTILVVEQNTNMALQIAHYGYVIENGKIVLEGSAEDLKENPDVKEFYLGGAGAEKDWLNLKSYRRRKRWLCFHRPRHQTGIQRTLHRHTARIQNMRVYHRRVQVLVPQQFLNGSYIVPRLQ